MCNEPTATLDFQDETETVGIPRPEVRLGFQGTHKYLATLESMKINMFLPVARFLSNLHPRAIFTGKTVRLFVSLDAPGEL
jgi:hypothetical protein